MWFGRVGTGGENVRKDCQQGTSEDLIIIQECRQHDVGVWLL